MCADSIWGVECWGLNNNGQLGDGTTVSKSKPVYATGLQKGVVAVSTGYNHTFAITRFGGAICWGFNFSGEVGDGSSNDRYSPVHVFGLYTGVKIIDASTEHTCAIDINGSYKCWGSNDVGQIGDGTLTNRYTPVNVLGVN